MWNILCSIMISSTFHVISRKFGLLFQQCIDRIRSTYPQFCIQGMFFCSSVTVDMIIKMQSIPCCRSESFMTPSLLAKLLATFSGHLMLCSPSESCSVITGQSFYFFHGILLRMRTLCSCQINVLAVVNRCSARLHCKIQESVFWMLSIVTKALFKGTGSPDLYISPIFFTKLAYQGS